MSADPASSLWRPYAEGSQSYDHTRDGGKIEKAGEGERGFIVARGDAALVLDGQWSLSTGRYGQS
ncbi:hypothetical protein [Novosphingobium sp. KACC 22771]|uniref:hypothetical protein n=1 Tax=Novosphingobium sp. KACC 22771 TaxID=3025670 RepID=UPI002366B7EB|nr:hypothetical protein [Novosphingobium sp. KACC 22771]WDF72514.1 hypothetical protein PQ467_00285 [Novosphingobium sp. KACC 22771]